MRVLLFGGVITADAAFMWQSGQKWNCLFSPTNASVALRIALRARHWIIRFIMTVPFRFAFIAAVASIFPLAQANAEPVVSSEGAILANFFAGRGFAGAKMSNFSDRYVSLMAKINEVEALLLLDTRAPSALIHRKNVAKFKLTENDGQSRLRAVAMGNCILVNVPVGIVDEGEMNRHTRLPSIDGLFGNAEMRKFGVVLDCGRKMLYISPNGPDPETSQKLGSMLVSRGFTRVPLQLNSGRFEADGALNKQPVRVVLDTAAEVTSVSEEAGTAAGISFAPARLRFSGAGSLAQQDSSGIATELLIGDFKIENAEVTLAKSDNESSASKTPENARAGFLGVEQLSFNSAIIDFGG
jgi:hypothetical protein